MFEWMKNIHGKLGQMSGEICATKNYREDGIMHCKMVGRGQGFVLLTHPDEETLQPAGSWKKLRGAGVNGGCARGE
ncbi:hypothetical protein [Verrucomicrobium spinosum]|uniref:hypothetical protein n=2 Tax=Verrucomicrobium spinosum TaxID=2736 RepID=UPI0012E2C44F|nr:hypothetical protein [Verrucomicrobium spinosum]